MCAANQARQYWRLSECLQISAELVLAAVGYRVNHGPHIFIESVFSRQSICILEQGSFLSVQPLVRLEYSLLLRLVQAGPIQTSLVDISNLWRIVSADSEERRNITGNPGKTRHEAPFADSDKLM
jgi:hypothetical protein